MTTNNNILLEIFVHNRWIMIKKKYIYIYHLVYSNISHDESVFGTFIDHINRRATCDYIYM